MGARGQRPKPTALRVLHGDRPSRINTEEPIADDGVPVCPTTDTEVRKIWDYTVGHLTRMGIASPADRDVLLCFCEAVLVHREASAQVAALGVLVPSGPRDNGALMRNPALAVQRDSALMIARFAQHFGLSPSARSEITKPRGQTSGAADDYLSA